MATIVLLLVLPASGPVGWAQVGGALVLLTAATAIGRASRRWDAPAAVIALLAIGLLREAAGGGSATYGVLVLVPVVWVALRGSSREVWIVVTTVAAVLLAPILVFGEPRYPVSGWRNALELTLCCALVGTTVQELLRRTRREATARRRLMSSIADGVIVTDRRGTVREVNTALCRMTGFAAEEIVGRSAPLPSWPAADHERLTRQHAEAIAAGGGQIDTRLVRKDGTEIEVSIALGVERSHDEVSVIATVKDVTERTRLQRRLSAEHQRFAAITAAMHEGFGVTREGRLVEVNRALCEITGFTRAQLIGAEPPFPFWPPELQADLEDLVRRIRATEGGTYEAVFQRADGTRFDAEATTVAMVGPTGGVEGYLNTVRDISDRKRRERLERDQARHAAAMAHVVRTFARADSENIEALVCDTVRDLTRADAAQLWIPTADGRVRPGWPVSGEPPPEMAEAELRPWLTSADQSRTWSVLPIRSAGVLHALLGVGWTLAADADDEPQTQVLELLAEEAAAAMLRVRTIDTLEALARTDPLTGLPNRRVLEERLARLDPAEHAHTVVLIDLDHFKRFNDTHGHLAGDRLLRTTGAAWSRRLRTSDLLVRWGGEEFCLLLRCSLSDAERVVDDLRQVMPDGQTFSAGLTRVRGVNRPAEVLAAADAALYAAKAAGRDRNVVA